LPALTDAGEEAMKLLIGILIFVWLACGLFGAWRLGDTRIKTILRGPITMAKAFNEVPVSYPGPD
jgi:hypothetical protein